MAQTVRKRVGKALTTDDLMRMQENREPPKKRHRMGSPEVAASNWLDDYEDTDSDNEAPPEDDVIPLDCAQDDEQYASQSSSSEQDDIPSSVPSRLDNIVHPETRSVPAVDSAPPHLHMERPGEPETSSFSALGVSPPLQAALASMSIKTPTPVQAACIPPLLSGACASKSQQ
jgi:ATP-dependent RNA helicase DDX49/DBP8